MQSWIKHGKKGKKHSQEEIAKAALFLSSEDSSFVNGTVVIAMQVGLLIKH